MSIVPDSRLGKIEFYEAHLTPWANEAVDIGLTPEEVGLLETDTLAARATYNAHLAAQLAAKNATQAFYQAVRTMHSSPGRGADMIQKIKTFAQTSNDPNVYVLAQIPPPATPGTTPPPGTPFDFGVSLLQSGALELKWKCSNPAGAAGTIYEVKRGGSSTGPFTYVGASGIRSFLDETLPMGSAPVTYQVTGVRSTVRGNPAQFTVNFGVGGGGFVITSVTEARGGAGEVKLAA